jgi:hypothetical protein
MSGWELLKVPYLLMFLKMATLPGIEPGLPP